MSAARKSFLERIKAFRIAIQEQALISQAPSETDHNNTARLLRNGLAIVGFALLEDFVRNRIGEVISRVGSSQIPFEELPDPLKDASVFGAVRALAYHGDLRRRQGDDYLSFIQQHSKLIGSTASTAYEVSALALGWDRPNITDSEVKEILRAFKIQDGWGNIDGFAARVGLTSPSLRDAFRQAAFRRHRAAHSAGADTEISHLTSFVPQAIAIALSFDALTSRSLRRFLNRDASFLADSGSIQHADVPIRFLDPSGAKWREVKEGHTRAVKRDADRAALTAACLARSNARDDVVIVRDSRQQPVEWYIPNVS